MSCFLVARSYGLIVNKIGGVRSHIIAGVSFLFLSIPIFYFISYGTLSQVILSIFLLSLMSSLNAAIIPGLLSEIIATEVRYTILGLSFNVSFGIFGGITPFLGLYLIKISGNIMLPSMYLSGISLLSLASLYLTLQSREKL